MKRVPFALISVAGSSGALCLACAAWFVRMPTSDGGLQALLPGFVWIVGSLLVLCSIPIWLNQGFEFWSRISPIWLRNLLLAPWILLLAATGALGSAAILVLLGLLVARPGNAA